MMIEDTTINTSRIPDTSFTYTPQISRFMQALEYNMKARAGINPAISSEDIAAQRNLEMEEDATAATERTLTSIDHSNPETMKSVLDSYRAYGRLLRSNSATAVIESFTDADIADRIVYDGVFRINATNTDQDYPVYITRGAIFESELIDNLENDNPSLYSYVRRFGAPVVLSIAGNIVKGAAGMFVTHGATAAYDVARLGTSIKNVQKKYHEWRNRLLNDETLTYDMFLEESKKLFADLKKEVPEEYRYEVYRALQEAPDPFADLGNSFTGLATDIGLIKPVGGIGKTGFTAAKRAMKGVTSAASKSKNVQKLQYNEELAEKIQNFATNKVDEEVVEDVVNTKAAVNIPQEASPELQDTVKGIVKEQESDNNLLQNVNNDSYRYDLTVSQEDIAAHNINTSAENRAQAAEEAFNKRQTINARRERAGQKGEIRLERPEQVTVTRVGKGVNNDPMTWEEVQKWRKAEQGRANPITPWKGGKHGLTQYFEYNPDIEPELIGIQSASRTSWTDDINKPGKWGYKEHQGEGAGDEWFFGGGYGSSIDSPWIAALEYYYKDDLPTEVQKIDDIINRFHKDYISDEEFSKARKMFDKDNYIYQKFLDNERMWKEEDEAVESATKSLRNNMERKYSIVKFLKDIGAKDETIDRIVDIENKFRGFNNDDIFQPNLIIDDIKQGLDEGSEHFNTIDSPDQLKQQIFKLSSDYKKLIKNMKEEFPDRDLDTLIELYKDHFKKHDDYLPHSVEFSEFVNNLAFFNHQVIAEEFYKHLKSIMTAEDFVPKTAYLQTLNDINPMKNPKGIFYYDDERGLIPFAELFNRANTEENYNKLLKIIQSDNAILDSIEKDAAEGMIKKYGYSNYSNSQKEEITENFINDMKSNRDRIGNWRSKLENFILPFDKNKQIATDRNYNAWEQDYLERKGVKRLWHNGGASQSFNISIQNFEDLTPVTLEETGIGTPWWTQTGYHNAHMIESAGDGVGYYGIIVHAPEGAKPIIFRNGKIVDKGDWK